jgi:hypothetical protein
MTGMMRGNREQYYRGGTTGSRSGDLLPLKIYKILTTLY